LYFCQCIVKTPHFFVFFFFSFFFSSDDPLELTGRYLNFEDLLARRRHYFEYRGSDTAPPCTEGVTWYVLGDYATAADSQISYLRDAMARTIGAKPGHDYGGNARPVQNWEGRRVSASAVPPLAAPTNPARAAATGGAGSGATAAAAEAAVRQRSAIVADAKASADAGDLGKKPASAAQVLADARARLQKADEEAKARKAAGGK
jgi:hypothetical protein